MPSKGKNTLLRRMIADGKAFVYRNNNWKAKVTVILSSPDEVAATVREITRSEKASPYGLSGFSITSAIGTGSHRSREYLMWVDDTQGMRTVSAIAHESVHIAGLILSDCGAPVNLDNIPASECLAYLVEDLTQFSLQNMEWSAVLDDVARMSSDRKKKTKRRPKNEHS